MRNLRIISTTIVDSSNIDVKFTDTLVPALVTSNVSIISDSPNVPDANVLGVSIVNDTMSIVCQPLSEFAAYFLTFRSTPQNPFISIHGDARLSEDGVTNQILIIGPLAPDNPVNDFFTSFLKDNVYEDQDDQTVVNKYLQSMSVNLARALYDIRQVKNENYLSFTVIDEQKTRGSGPYDRLNEEGAYEVLRVGRNLTNAGANTTFSFDDFPSYPITLLRQSETETLQASSLDELGKFNINTLTLNLNNHPVTKVNSIIFTFVSANPVYNYDIETLGYQILDSRYDQDFGFTYLQLSDNQIRISDTVLQNPNFDLNNILKIDVIYEVKNLGRVVDPNSVSVYTILTSVREVIPPIINVFNLDNSPIVTGGNVIPTLGGVIFTDPNTTLPGAKHPAFINEIPFRLNGLPFIPGQYSIDYTSGTVYVYGSDSNNDGTGPFPPLATYQYRYIYKFDQDYSYDSDTADLVSLPKGSLVDFNGNILFNYEDQFVPGVDYVAGAHQESLNERIGNNLAAMNVLKTAQSPITNVFRIFNETSGEIYTLDRWNGNKVYFRYNNPPTISSQVAERATFQDVLNELLTVNTILNNTSSLRIYKVLFNNNNLVSSTEDCLASSFNTSLSLSRNDIFIQEKWFNRKELESINIDKLVNVGEYMVDYPNGILYAAVSITQDFNIGTASYKRSFIVLNNPHIISADDLYYQISSLNPKNKQFTYVEFEDGLIEPNTLDPSDELFLNNTDTAPYQILGGQVGIFLATSFLTGVTSQVKFVRSVFEYNDLVNSTHPLNFMESSTFSGFNITVAPIVKQVFDTVKFDGTNYYVTINENIPYFSGSIVYSFNVTRVSDSQFLFDPSGSVVPGNPVKIILSTINSPSVGDLVIVDYSFTISDVSRLVVDYNKGDFFIDYTYLADEILISYEYGDNVLDFRTSSSIPNNSIYYVTYKVGALRDSLVKNFGTLLNVQGLANIDLEFARERYRDALVAGLTSFIQGPTLSAIKNIGKTISHIEPEVIESAFQDWSLGNSLLNPESISTTGSFQLLPAKFGNGVLINSNSQNITFPVSSNLRLEEGTFETWIMPQWNGLDNDANLTFNILKDGYLVDPSLIFIGAGEFHPTISGGIFSLNKNSSAIGKPNTNKDGIFIYYDKDIFGNFQRWYVEIIDGYVDPGSSGYKFKISSDGSFYDVKSIILPKPSNMIIFTGIGSISFNIAPGSHGIDEGLTFISDNEHYILDFGQDVNKNRLSIFKDVSGYMNFKVYDREGTAYSVSADVSAWKINELHHVAASWKLNTRDNRDELHLFLDGFEVPNIIKYGQKLKPYLHEKFRTINPEEIIGLVSRDIVASIDLHTIAGQTNVSSSIVFSNFKIFAGDTIFIDEIGFDPAGYTIVSISGQSLELNIPMPLSLIDGRFSVNRAQFTVLSDIDTSPNVIVTTIHDTVSGTDLMGAAGFNIVVSGSTNFTTQGVEPGFLLRIDDNNLPITYTIAQVSGSSLTIDDNLPINISSATFRIYSHQENEIPGVRALRPSYSISKDTNFNNILTLSNNVMAGDLILIRTLGVNHRDIKKEYYVWSDNKENILMTRMPPPISLDEADITKIILPATTIGTNNSSVSGGILTSNNLVTTQPSNSQNGRSISISISGTNVDFSAPVQVTINGMSYVGPVTETISFTDYGSLDFANQYISINYINVVVKPININRTAVTITSKEKYPITHSELSGLVPVIRYSYQIGTGYGLYSDTSYSVRDDNVLFSGLDIGNYLVISSPVPVAGFYIITGISVDRKSLFIKSTIPSFHLPLSTFAGGIYQILNVNANRSGLQNGFFTLEDSLLPSQAYFLSHGFYELSYATYNRIKFDPIRTHAYLGSDFRGQRQANCVIDQMKIYSVMLTDTRVGESVPSNQRSITKDFNSLKPLTSDANTLMLVDFDTFPFTNAASFYTTPATVKNYFQSSLVVNENFGNSLVFLDQPLLVPNDGILDTKKEGTIEFWMNPMFDTSNDPNTRFYFDAYGAVVEEAISVNNTAVKISAPAGQILSVKLKGGDPSIDYFVGGKLEIDTQRAIQEEGVSSSNSTVLVSQPALQIMTVKIIGDLTETDYFNNGSISSDRKTIYLGKLLPGNNIALVITYQTTNNNNETFNTQVIRLNRKLPYQKSHVVVNYIPKGLQGDRLSIFKDQFGYMNFSIVASGIDYVVRAPTLWAQHSWHRVKASYKLNSGLGTDEMRLFLDGYEFSNVRFGNGIYGSFPQSYGTTFAGDGYLLLDNIRFKDPINDLFIGSQYDERFPIFSLIDNFRISDISRPIYAPYGEPLDVNYSSNLNAVFPVTADLYTTYLLDFNTLSSVNDDFATLKNRETGDFDFSVNVFDSFGIISSNIKSQEALENLIKVLKPANSRVFISYIR